MKQVKMYMILLISTLLIFNIACPSQPVYAEQAARDEGQKQYGRSNTYFYYIEEHKDVADADKAIELPLASARLEGGQLKEKVKGRELAISLGKSDSAIFHFESESDALYAIELEYMPAEDKPSNLDISLTLNNEIPFIESQSITLGRMYKDLEKKQDSHGNDLIPEQEEIFSWQKTLLFDYSIWTDKPLKVFVKRGQNSLEISSRSGLYIASVRLVPQTQPDEAEKVVAEYRDQGPYEPVGVSIKQQAEDTSYKSSSSIVPVYDKSSPVTEPYHVSKIRRNTIGQEKWSKPGSWVSYIIDDVPEDGLYHITLKYRQNKKIGMSSFRNIYINGELPYQEFSSLAFPYGVNWENKTITKFDGGSYPVYLQKGTNEIRIEATLGHLSEVLQAVDEINYRLNNMYIKIVMVTGSTPDRFRDYYLDREIPDLIEVLVDQREQLLKACDRLEQLSGDSSQSAVLKRAVDQLESLVKNPDSIPRRLANYRDTVSSISSWLYENMEQPLELDYLIIHSEDSKIAKASPNLWQRIKHSIAAFFASFTEDYDSFDEYEESENPITVWVNTGRDQIQIIKDMTLDGFTAETGIPVNLSLVKSGFIEATLAGTGPDVAINIARGQPINLASRGVLADLASFEDFEQVKERFGETAMVPYQFLDGTYALPNTQTFYMMFYRTDILDTLGLEPPDTWDDLFRMLPRLQKNNMSIGLPYSIISAAVAVDMGMGSRDLFPLLLLQNGGDFYSDDYKMTRFDEEKALLAFRQWTDFYTKYGFDLAYDLYTRFRTGEMPIGIASFEMHNMLTVAAPEIRNQWSIAPIPATVREDGSLDRTVSGAGTAAIIFNKADDLDACWEFLKWWTDEETQYQYGMSVENIMGPAARFPTANEEAFNRLPWPEQDLETINYQRQFVKEIAEIPGSYFVSRCLDNAFRAVLFDGENSREVFERENANINREIARKRYELGLD